MQPFVAEYQRIFQGMLLLLLYQPVEPSPRVLGLKCLAHT